MDALRHNLRPLKVYLNSILIVSWRMWGRLIVNKKVLIYRTLPVTHSFVGS
jgi:hypothetical protein